MAPRRPKQIAQLHTPPAAAGLGQARQDTPGGKS